MRKPVNVLNAILCILLTVVFLPGVTPASAQAEFLSTAFQGENVRAVSLTLADLGYKDIVLEGQYSSTTYALGIPGAWEIQPGSTLNLAIRHDFGTQEPPEITSGGVTRYFTPVVSLQVVLNDVTIYREVLEDAVDQELTITFPTAWPKRITPDLDYLKIMVRVNGPCEASLFNALSIFSSSRLDLKYRTRPLALNLTSYPQPLYQRSFLPNQVDMVIGENISTAQLEAAYSVTAGLGSLARNRTQLEAVLDKAFSPVLNGDDHLIVVGTPENNSMIAELSEQGKLPVKVNPRLLKVSTSGPDLLVPGQSAAFKIRVENTEAAVMDRLTLRSWLPNQAAGYKCDPACSVENGQAVWRLASLPAGSSLDLTLTVTLPANAPMGSAYLNSELAQSFKPVNVSTLPTSVKASGTPNTVQSQPANATFFTQNNRAVPETAGVVQFVQSPWDASRAVLLVTGLNDEAVTKAGQAMGSSTRFPGMSGQVAIVQDILPGPAEPPLPKTVFTFADLGYKDSVGTGLFSRDFYYGFDIPMNWTLAEDASVTLHFSHSSTLDKDKSAITLIFNDNPIGSVALDESNAANGVLTVLLPPRSARPGSVNNLVVRVESDMTDPCVDPETDQAWVTISATSLFNLSHTEGDAQNLINLDYWPRPLINTTNRSLKDILIALPEKPTAAEHTLAFRVMSFLGYSGGGLETFKPNVLIGAPGDADLANYSIVAIGRPTRNPVLKAANDQLPQPFVPETDLIQQKIDNVIFQLPDGVDLGYVQLAASPWNEERILIAATGTSDAGVGLSANLLYDSDLARQMEGNLVLVRGLDVYTTDTRNTAGSEIAATADEPPATADVTPAATQQPAAASTPEAVSGGTPQTVSGVEATATAPVEAQRAPNLLMIGIIVAVVLAILGTFGWSVWQSRRS